MPTTKTVTLYTYDELSPEAKERAREWCRAGEEEMFFAFGLPDGEDIETIAGFLGISFDRHDVKLMGGGTRSEPDVWCSFEYSHVPGCAFSGWYQHCIGGGAQLRQHAPQDTELHALADRLQAVQRRHFYGLTARIRAGRGEPNARNMEISVEKARGRILLADNDAEEIESAIKDFAGWIYRHLESDLQYRLGDESVEDMLRGNEYTFTEDGTRED